MHDTKLKTEEDIKEVLDYPVIGIIPEFKIGKNTGDTY
jgi:capsular polysaccharide biosynthesis protein